MQLQYRQIIHTLPQHWKETMKHLAGNLNNLYIQDNQLCNTIYSLEIFNSSEKPTCHDYHKKKFDEYDFNWKLVYRITRIASYETKIRLFNHKLLKDVLYLNKKLFYFGIISQSQCSFCYMMKHCSIFFMNVLIQNIYGTNFDYILQKKLHYHFQLHRVSSLTLLIFQTRTIFQ